MPFVIQFRRDTAANWTSANPTLADGEMGIESDTNKYKIGNGYTVWNSLSYSSLPANVLSPTVVDAKGDLLVGTADDTVDNLAVGANGTLLIADSAETTGMRWGSTVSGVTINNSVVQGLEESWNVAATAATGTVNFNTLTSTAWLYTSNASGNWTLNVRGDGSTTLDSLLAVGDSITVVFAVTQGATAYYPTAFRVDDSAVTPKWQGGSAPTGGNASSIDVYVYTIIKTAATPTYTVLASQTQFA